VKNVFALTRSTEVAAFDPYTDPKRYFVHSSKTQRCFADNFLFRQLVHASRASNFVGLLSRGLLLPSTVLREGLSRRTDFGYLGAGIYFSDHLAASIRYTAPQPVGSPLVLRGRLT
jgi:hypothetical protein